MLKCTLAGCKMSDGNASCVFLFYQHNIWYLCNVCLDGKTLEIPRCFPYAETSGCITLWDNWYDKNHTEGSRVVHMRSWIPHATLDTHTENPDKPFCRLSSVVSTVISVCGQRSKHLPYININAERRGSSRDRGKNKAWKRIVSNNTEASSV